MLPEQLDHINSIIYVDSSSIAIPNNHDQYLHQVYRTYIRSLQRSIYFVSGNPTNKTQNLAVGRCVIINDTPGQKVKRCGSFMSACFKIIINSDSEHALQGIKWAKCGKF